MRAAIRKAFHCLIITCALTLTWRIASARDAGKINEQNRIALMRFQTLMSDVAPLLAQFKQRGYTDAMSARKLRVWRARAEGLISLWMQPGHDEFSTDEIDESLLDHTVIAQHKLAYTLKAVDAAISSCPKAYSQFMMAEQDSPNISIETGNAYDDAIDSYIPDTALYRRGMMLLHTCRLQTHGR